MRSDLHHLRSSVSTINSTRGNTPFDCVQSPDHTYIITMVDYMSKIGQERVLQE